MKKICNRIRIFFDSLKEARDAKTKISKIGIGILFFQIVNKFAIIFINPFIIAFFDFWTALTLMIIISFIIRYSLIIFYDHQKIDWVNIEKFKFLQSKGLSITKEKRTTLIKIMIGALKVGRFFVICVLVPYDPFLTVIYQREGHNEWNNIPKISTWIFFALSIIICALISISWIKPVIEWLKPIFISILIKIGSLFI